MISLLSYEDEDVVEMALRVVGTCVGDNSSGKMWSLQFDRKVLSYVIKATEHQSLMVKKATVKSFGSLLWTAQRMCERSEFLFFCLPPFFSPFPHLPPPSSFPPPQKQLRYQHR